MPTNKHKLSRSASRTSWPKTFTEPRRYFIPKEENKSYLEFIQDIHRNLSKIGHGLNEDERENNDEGGGEENDDSEENDEEDNNEDDENIEQNTVSCPDGHNNVEIFMRGGEGDDQALEQDQVDQVVNFCKHATVGNKRPVALLDCRNNGRSMRTKKGERRPYLGPLTVPKLLKELSKPRFSTSTNAFVNDEVDAERCLIFINDLNSSSIEVLAATTLLRQAPAVKNLIYNHINSNASIDVDIPSHGFPRFTLEFSLPYFVRQPHKDLPIRKDPRTNPDGSPLRQSWESLSFPGSKLPTSYIYEAHTAIAVTGSDHQVWTAFCFVDTYFGHRDRVDGYDREGDPLSAGRISANYPFISDPREYFVRILEIRILIIVKEWNATIKEEQKDIKQSGTYDFSSCDPKMRQEKRKLIQNWSSHKIKALRFYKEFLSESIGAWKNFSDTDRAYFDGIKDTLALSFKAIDKAFKRLSRLLQKVKEMIKELQQDYPLGLHAQLSFENNEAAVVQQHSANNIQVLTYITIIFIPVAVASSLFSMQGVLPFTPNLTHFAWVLIILIILVVVTLIVLSNWEKCLLPVLNFFHTNISNQLLHIISSLAPEGKRRGMEIAHRIEDTGRAMARAIFSRPRRGDGDLEGGEEIVLDAL